MAHATRAGFYASIATLLATAVGCGLSKPALRHDSAAASAPSPQQPESSARALDEPSPTQGSLQQVVHRLPAVAPAGFSQGEVMSANQQELSLATLLADVEARNPSLQAMVFAWRATAQRYPQVVSLDDPMFMTMMAPASFSSNQVEAAYVLQGSQKLPWFGKRDLRGQAAQAEAGAAFQDVNDTRLQVAQVTRIAFYDYYLVERTSELIEQNGRVMQQFRDAAQVKYENNQVTQQDVLQADLELSEIERRHFENERMRHVAMARINTLLRRAPGDALPPPPRTLTIEVGPPPIASLQQLAATERPDLAALAARVRAEEAAVDLARKQYYPDAEFFGRYDSFWQPASTQSALRPQVGVNMNVPIYRRKLEAAVCEAEFRLSQRRAEYQQRILDVQYEVQSAYEQVQESRRTADLYAQRLLPFAEQNVQVARSNYDVGKLNFLFLAQAQRQLIEVREKYQQTLTDYHRRAAELQRAVGGSLPPAKTLEEIPNPRMP